MAPIGGATFYINLYREVYIYHLAIFSQLWLEVSIGKEMSDLWEKRGFKFAKSKGLAPLGSNKGKKGVTFCEFKKNLLVNCSSKYSNI